MSEFGGVRVVAAPTKKNHYKWGRCFFCCSCPFRSWQVSPRLCLYCLSFAFCLLPFALRPCVCLLLHLFICLLCCRTCLLFCLLCGILICLLYSVLVCLLFCMLCCFFFCLIACLLLCLLVCVLRCQAPCCLFLCFLSPNRLGPL